MIQGEGITRILAQQLTNQKVEFLAVQKSDDIIKYIDTNLNNVINYIVENNSNNYYVALQYQDK